MLKHIGEGLTPFEDCGFSRTPEMPLIGEAVTVRCRVDDRDAEPVLHLCAGPQERVVYAVEKSRQGNRRFYSFAIGSFETAQTVSYQIEAGEERTPWVSFEVLQKERFSHGTVVLSTVQALWLALTDDLLIELEWDGSIRLVQKPVPANSCQMQAVPLTDEMCFEAGKNSIWLLKRLSDPLLEAVAYTVFRNAEGAVRKVETELRLTCACVMGTGERFDAVNQFGRSSNGRVVEKFTHQGEQTYLPIPFFFTEQGWGWYRMGSIPAKMRFGQSMTIEQATEGTLLTSDRLLLGQPKEILSAFLMQTGKAVLPPQWAFGVWISGNGWNCDAEVGAQLDALKRYDYPASVMVLEQWSDERTFYLWHESHWADPAALVQRIRDAGLHLLLWQIPVIKYEWEGCPGETLENDTREAIEKGYVVKSADGSPYRITENWFHHSLLPDFTNPDAVCWWFEKRRYLLEMGVEGFKTDGGEFLFENDAKLHGGESGKSAHNLYPVQYAAAYHRFLQQSGVNGVTFSRAGFVGAQTQPIHWAGDQKSEWSELRAQLCAGITAGLSGVLFWGFDIGGFAGPIPDAELYLRATAMACFAPVMQWHSEPRGGQFGGEREENNDRSPWNLAKRLKDDRVLTIGCAYARLRETLRPYLWREAQACVRLGRPMMAHLCFDYPEDRNAWGIDDQYMLGRELLVAPVIRPGVLSTAVYLPRGRWLDFFTGERHQGPCRLSVDAPLERIPVFRKEPCDDECTD